LKTERCPIALPLTFDDKERVISYATLVDLPFLEYLISIFD